jgi:cell division protein FtsW (lipid II flippase)
MITTSHIDWLILLPIVGLLMFSVAFVYSASSSFAMVKYGSSEQLFWNHAIRVLLGMGLLIFCAKLDYHFWERSTSSIMMIAIGFLIVVFFVGVEAKGASRWVRQLSTVRTRKVCGRVSHGSHPCTAQDLRS